MSTSVILRTTALALAVGLTCGAAQAQQRVPATPAAGPAQVDTAILPAQEIGTIVVGQTRRGTLEPGDWTMSDGTFADVWYIQGTQGQRVVITLRSSAFDSYLQLLDAGGTKVADDDDSGGGNRAARITFTFRANERYQVVVNNYSDEVAAGLYTLEIR
jgi:serine protease Do